MLRTADPGHAWSAGAVAESRKWISLGFIALAQLMIALDATIVNIALPSVQRALGFSDAQRQWVITAYTLAFAGLLLLGGRIADYAGQKRAFLIGLIGFGAASALGGAASDFRHLVGARALQGAFGAMLAPAALSLLAVTFTEPRERAKAFAVYGGIAGSGGLAGLVLGGLVTQYLNWRWCLYINVIIAAIAAGGGRAVLVHHASGGKPRLDIPGVLLAAGGLAAVVYACAEAVPLGWGSRPVFAFFAAAAVSMTLFVLRQARTAAPLLPLRIVADRNRGGACVTAALAVVGMSGVFMLLTYYFQVVLSYSPLAAGLAFLPLTLALLAGSGLIASRLLPYVPPRALMSPGLLVAAAGMALLAGLRIDSRYLPHILPAEIVVGLGMGCVMVPAFSVGTQGVERSEIGVAAATVNTAQQVGGYVGTALLNTIATGVTAASMAFPAEGPAGRLVALVHGYAAATRWAVVVFVVAAALAALMIDVGAPQRRPG